MQNYIKNNIYLPVEFKEEDIIELSVPQYKRVQLEKHHPSYLDANEDFSQAKFKYPYIPLHLGKYDIAQIEKIDVNVLRIMIRENDENQSIFLPKNLLMLKDFILDNINYHRQYYSINRNCYIYLTVRSSTYEDLFYKNSFEWHIDGFQGSRIKRYIIEQNAFWCNDSATQFLLQPFFCEGLNAAKHDINDYFNKNANENFLIETKPYNTYFVNPYNVHRVNPKKFKGKRIFIRINFSPFLIEDSTNTINPVFQQYLFEKRRDVRDFLNRYKLCEKDDNGFKF